LAEYPDALLQFAVAACVLFILVGVPGNFITILALLRYTKVRNATAMFIINLSVSDLMFCCFNLPLATSNFYHRAWVHGPTLCVLFPLMRYGLVAVSIFTVLAITLNRYIMIGHPRLYPRLYKRRLLILMIALTWLGCFGSLLPTLFGQWGVFGLDEEMGSCSILQDRHQHSPKEFLFVVAFLLPCVAIVVCYARIFFIVRQAAAVSHGQRPMKSLGGADPRSSGPDQPRNNAKPIYKSRVKTGSGEPSYQLTCCDSQHGSGSTEMSDDHVTTATSEPTEPLRSGKVVSGGSGASGGRAASGAVGTIMRWKENSACPKSAVRIQVEQGSVGGSEAGDDLKHMASPVRVQPERRRISVTFSLGIESHPAVAATADPHSQYLCVPSASAPRTASPTCRRGSQASLALEKPSASDLNSPDHSDISSIGSGAAVDGRSASLAFSTAVSQVSSAFHRRSTRSKRHPGRMTAKDRKLLQMILVIFVSFIVCYMPITIVKIVSKDHDLGALNIIGYILIYLTTCINPIIYVVMSSEYRQAYKNLLTCKRNSERGPLPSRTFSQRA